MVSLELLQQKVDGIFVLRCCVYEADGKIPPKENGCVLMKKYLFLFILSLFGFTYFIGIILSK